MLCVWMAAVPTYLEYKGTVYNNATVLVQNAIALHIKHMTPSFAVGDKVRIDGVFD